MTNPLPTEVLEARAAQQRRELHNSVVALRQTVRHRLDVRENVRNNLPAVAGGIALLGLVLGYGVGSMIKH